MFKKFRKWLYGRFLPKVTKDQYLEEMEALNKAVRALKAENAELKAYIDGMQYAICRGHRITINNRNTLPGHSEVNDD